MFANATTEQISQIQEILQQLDRVIAAPDVSNRRRANRIKIRSEMSVILLASTGLPSVKIFSRNLSTSGLGFISRRPFNKGERVAIAIELAGHPPKLVLAQTTFSRYVRAGVYEMGAEFIESIADTKGMDRIPERWLPSMTHKPSTTAAAKA